MSDRAFCETENCLFCGEDNICLNGGKLSIRDGRCAQFHRKPDCVKMRTPFGVLSATAPGFPGEMTIDLCPDEGSPNGSVQRCLASVTVRKEDDGSSIMELSVFNDPIINHNKSTFTLLRKPAPGKEAWEIRWAGGDHICTRKSVAEVEEFLRWSNLLTDDELQIVPPMPVASPMTPQVFLAQYANTLFCSGARVFDRECGEYGTVLHFLSRSVVAVQYDQDYGCEKNTCAVDLEHLELAGENDPRNCAPDE